MGKLEARHVILKPTAGHKIEQFISSQSLFVGQEHQELLQHLLSCNLRYKTFMTTVVLVTS